MDLIFNPEQYKHHKVNPSLVETYVNFRSQIPKPTHEDAHLRHILRFYIARAFLKTGAKDVYITPELQVDGQAISVDVMGVGGEKTLLAVCEPESITEKTQTILDVLRKLENVETVVVYSSYGSPGNAPEKYKDEISQKQIRLMAVVPPPFDDVYEYDIWMFETTFRELYAGGE